MLRDAMRQKSLMDCFIEVSKDVNRGPWFERHLELFLEVCEAHGQTALQHHEQLVAKFIEHPVSAAKCLQIVMTYPPADHHVTVA